MKKLTFLLSAVALLGLASCTEPQEINPNYNPVDKTVNANFVFNIATNVAPATKMTGADAQANVTSAATFRGINNGKLIAYTLSSDGKTIYPSGGQTATTFPTVGKVFDLPTIVPANSLAPNGSGAADKSRRILELSVPVGTNSFMFYGKAIKTGTDDAQGAIDFNLNTADLGASRFNLKPRYSATGDTKVEFDQIEALIAAVITNFLSAEVASGATITFGDATFNTGIKWSDFATMNSTSKVWSCKTVSPVDGTSGITAMEEILGKAFANFVNIKAGAVRAGSGQAIARQIGDLTVTIGGVAKATPTSLNEAVANQLAKNIITKFSNIFAIGHNPSEVSNFSNVTTDADGVDWRDATEVINDLAAIGVTGLQTNKVTNGKLKAFPTEFGLPMGAAQLLINPETLVASYNSSSINPFDDPSNVTGDVTKIMYPAELCYFGNSPIRVTDNVLDKADYPDGAGATDGEWLNNNSWVSKAWSARGAHVLSSTRSIAMADNVNYGTALLEATVEYSDAITDANPMVDNTKAFFSEEDPKSWKPGEITAGMFQLTGILVGGQNNVGWNYIPVSNSDNFIIYDKLAAAMDIPAPGSKTDANYTLVWDNYDGSVAANAQTEVYVALEFVNKTEKDFWGEHNVIRKDGTFYIAGKLIPSKSKTTITWPADPDFYALPPYDSNGKTIQAPRVFIQDYKTTVAFKIGPESLKKAYVTVPDLRSGQISFGLSVDLQWRSGMSFDVVLGE